MPLSLTDHVTATPNVVFRALGDEAIVLHLDGGLYFGLDEVGTRMWILLADHDLGGVAEALSREFDVTAATAVADVVEFVEQLAAKGLVTKAGDD